MFRNNDKLTLSLVNARDIDGNIIPFSLKLPLNNKEYKLPKELASIDVFEYHEGLLTGGDIVFSIYVGEITTIEKLIPGIQNKTVKISKNLGISSITNPICFQNISEQKVVFATLNEQDIVVENQQQLAIIIEQLSNNYTVLCDSVTKIRTLSKKK